MSKRKYRRGGHIMSLDELARQEIIFFRKQPVHFGWFGNWQLRMCQKLIGKDGVLYYAIKEDDTE